MVFFSWLGFTLRLPGSLKPATDRPIKDSRKCDFGAVEAVVILLQAALVRETGEALWD
jgi:hypothetical protein